MEHKERPGVAFFLNNLKHMSIPLDWIRVLAGWRYPVTLVLLYRNNEPDLVDELHRAGVRVLIRSPRLKILWIIQVFRLAGRLRRDGIRVIHTHHTFSDIIGFLVARIGGMQYLQTVHNDFRYFSPATRLEKTILLRNKAAAYNSRHTLESSGKVAERTSVNFIVYNGIPFGTMPENPVVSLKESGEINIVFAARLIPQKDLDTLLQAFRILQIRGKGSILLHVAGDGSESRKFRSYIADHGLNNIKWYGMMPRERVYGLMHACSVFLLTSVYEGFCNAAVEAMHYGCAVISTGIEPLVTEVVGPDGIYFPVGDSDALADILEHLDTDDIRRRGDSLRHRADQTFDNVRSVEGYMDIYGKLAANG